MRRSGVNYTQYLKMCTYKNFDEFLKKNIANNPNSRMYFLTRYGTHHIYEVDASNQDLDYYLILGKESTGIPKEILKNYLDKCIRLPMTDKVRALNVSNSVAIVLYEALRQQDYLDLLRDEPHKSINYIEEAGDINEM